MPVRLVIQPVVFVSDARRPLSETLADPGRPAVQVLLDDRTLVVVPKALVHTSAISDGSPGQRNEDCLSLVAGVSLAKLDTAPGVTTLFETGSDQTLSNKSAWLINNTPDSLNWNAAKRARVLGQLTKLGVDIVGLGGNTPLYLIANRLGKLWSLSWDVRKVNTFYVGADVAGLGVTMPVYPIANRLGQLWSPSRRTRQIIPSRAAA